GAGGTEGRIFGKPTTSERSSTSRGEPATHKGISSTEGRIFGEPMTLEKPASRVASQQLLKAKGANCSEGRIFGEVNNSGGASHVEDLGVQCLQVERYASGRVICARRCDISLQKAYFEKVARFGAPSSKKLRAMPQCEIMFIAMSSGITTSVTTPIKSRF
ncbi:hypothetical protein E4U38_007283, partial [Claviceps purpurea]